MPRTCLFTVAALATALTGSAALAQQQQAQTQRVSGTIERVDGNTIYGKGANGSAITLKLADKAPITAVLKATFADIKPGDYVGTGGIPQADGSQKAVELRIFPKPQQDGGHFNEGWYGAPNGTMTNGFVQPVTVTATATGAGDPSITVKYPQGEKRIVISSSTHLVRNVVGSKDDLKAGAVFRAQAATKQPDGTYTATALAVGRDGARPF
jgi:WD40 repeat protein